MASVIQLARYRSVTQRDLPLPVFVGDSDLRPIAIVLWIGSAVRVALTLLHGQTFGAESTLALACAIGLPIALLRARCLPDTAQQ